NTQYAVMALYAASKAGIKIDEAVWKEIQSFYLRTQQEDGGWVYNPAFATGAGASTLTMTCAGISGLAIAKDRLKDSEELDEALSRAIRHLGGRFAVAQPFQQFYLLHSMARAGRLSGKETFPGKQPNEEHPWYRVGAHALLVKQQDNGAWKDTGRGGL